MSVTEILHKSSPSSRDVQEGHHAERVVASDSESSSSVASASDFPISPPAKQATKTLSKPQEPKSPTDFGHSPKHKLQLSQEDRTDSPTQGSNKRKRKSKDPAAPKRARTSFVLFTMEMRPKIVKEFPGIKFIDVGNILGERWRGLTQDEKKRFEKMAAQDKIRFQREMDAYPGNQASVSLSSSTSPTSLKDAKRIKSSALKRESVFQKRQGICRSHPLAHIPQSVRGNRREIEENRQPPSPTAYSGQSSRARFFEQTQRTSGGNFTVFFGSNDGGANRLKTTPLKEDTARGMRHQPQVSPILSPNPTGHGQLSWEEPRPLRLQHSRGEVLEFSPAQSPKTTLVRSPGATSHLSPYPAQQTNGRASQTTHTTAQPRSHVGKDSKEQLFAFVRVLLKYLEKHDATLHQRARMVIRECYEKNKSKDLSYEYWGQSMRSRLRETVGEICWNKTEEYLWHQQYKHKNAAQQRAVE